MAGPSTINAADISEKARRDLLRLLEAFRGKKNLVIEKALAVTLGLFVKFSTLQEYGVNRVFFLENANVDSSERNVVFLARGEKPAVVKAVAAQVKSLRHNSQISVIWVPRRTILSDRVLEEEGVLGDVTVNHYQLYFIPLAEDLLSLELDDAFEDIYLNNDPTPTFLAAKSLALMQQKFGLFPRITGKGDHARRLADLLIRMRAEMSMSDSSNDEVSMLDLTPSTTIESLIIIDREVDFPSALLTQLTYEGLIDEFLGISANQTEVDSSIVGAASQASLGASSSAPAQPHTMKRKIMLDGTDSLYPTLRDANCAVVGPMLNNVARRLQRVYENRSTAGKTTAELREFISKLPGIQSEQTSLKLHTSLAEEIIKRTRTDNFTTTLEVQQNIAAGADPSLQHDNIENLVARDVPIATVLRLMCIESTFGNGLRAKDLEKFKSLILHGYGHQHLLTLNSLEKMGLLTPRTGGGALAALSTTSGSTTQGKTTNYNTVRSSLHLIIDEVNESEPDDAAYAFSGYAPLSVRLVQCILQKDYLLSLSQPQRKAAQQPAAAAGPDGAGDVTPTAPAPSAGHGWRPFEDAVKAVRGATFDEVQAGEEKAVRARQILNGSGAASGPEGGKTVVVFYLGGITRAEVAALRYVAARLKEESRPRRLVICTTSVVRGDQVVGAAVEGRRFA